MAGDWLKMECSTPDKPEVLAITARLGWDDPDLTVGKLFRLWRWFDQQTVDGNAPGVTSALLDRVVGVTGFCDAVASVGWLVVTGAGIALQEFDRHNGNTAKNRALTAKRVANHKAKAPGNATGNASANDEGNAGSVSGALPREREEKNSSSLRSEEGKRTGKPRAVLSADEVMADSQATEQHVRDWFRVRKVPLTRTAWDAFKANAGKAGISVAQAVEVCALAGWRGFDPTWAWQKHLPGHAAQVVAQAPRFAAAERPLTPAERRAFQSSPHLCDERVHRLMAAERRTPHPDTIDMESSHGTARILG